MSDPVSRLNAALEGRYRIERELGEGGMATVYLAEDLRHQRRVALKVLKPELAAVLGFERFLAEIRTTANLQHPHILPLFDSGEAGGFLYYVMPHVGGKSLRERLDAEKQLSIDEAVGVAEAVALALDFAHSQGIIHRDIKPGNILFQAGQPMVGDFGIALAVGAGGGARLTETGLSLGTPYYMSPEQATGDQRVGPRSDIYSLGCVLFEMLVGDPPYTGSTAQAVLGQIVASKPVVASERRTAVPPHVDGAIRKALERVPADRFASAGAFAEALRDPSFRYGDIVASADRARLWNPLSIAATSVALLLAASLGWALSRSEVPEPMTRLSIQPASGQVLQGGALFDISADGRVLAWLGPDPEQPSADGIWVRRLGSREPVFLPLSYGYPPALSPDGSQVAFRGPGGIRVESLAGEVGRTLAQELDSVIAPVVRWSPDGQRLYFLVAGGGSPLRIMRVPVTGGPVEEVAPVHSGSAAGHWFDVLPTEGAAVLQHPVGTAMTLELIDFATGELRELMTGGSPRYADGYLLFTAAGGSTLMAVPFDAERGEATGDAATVAEGLVPTLLTPGHYAASQSGVLLYALGPVADAGYHVATLDREGVVTTPDPDWTFDPGGNNRGLALSPDGDRLALTIFDQGNYDVWVKELPRGPLQRLSFSEGWDVRPRWTRDGRVLWLSMFGNSQQDMRVVARSASGTGDIVQLMDHELPFYEAVVTPGMGWLLGRTGGTALNRGGRDVWAMEIGVDSVARRLLVTSYDEKAIDVSPDGRWLLYESDETGRNEIYVRPFPNVDDDKITISTAGGVMPKWSRRGGEIFYIDTGRELIAASVSTERRFRVTERKPLFTLPEGILFRPDEQYALYDVASDDQTFYFFSAAETAASTPELVMVQNWTEGLPIR